MTTHLVFEKATDKKIIAALLKDLAETSKLKTYLREGKNNARPWARRLQSDHREPVVLISNSNTTDEETIREDRNILCSYLGFLSNACGGPCHVCLFVPNVEILFFKDKLWLEKAINHQIYPTVFNAGQYAPKQILNQLMKEAGVKSIDTIIDQLDETILLAIRKTPVISELRKFVKEYA